MNTKKKKPAAGPFAKTTTTPSLGETLAQSQLINLAAVHSRLKEKLGEVQNEVRHFSDASNAPKQTVKRAKESYPPASHLLSHAIPPVNFENPSSPSASASSSSSSSSLSSSSSSASSCSSLSSSSSSLSASPLLPFTSAFPMMDSVPNKKHLLSLRRHLLSENKQQLQVLQYLHAMESDIRSRIEELENELNSGPLSSSPNIRWPTSPLIFLLITVVSPSHQSFEAKFFSDAFFSFFHLDPDAFRGPLPESWFAENIWSKQPIGLQLYKAHKAMLRQCLQRGASGTSFPCLYRRKTLKAIASASASSETDDQYENVELLPSWQILNPFPNLQFLFCLIPK